MHTDIRVWKVYIQFFRLQIFEDTGFRETLFEIKLKCVLNFAFHYL